MSNHTNLYDLLRRLQRDSEGTPGAITLTPDEKEFLNAYLQAPDAGIHFRALRQGGTDENPIYHQSYAIAGDGEVVFCLLTEACMQNPTFANLVAGAAEFMRSHVRSCPDCRRAVAEAAIDWAFKEHHRPDDEKDHFFKAYGPM